MNAKLKTHLGNIFVSQVNNERAINSAKTYPWWVAIIMLILGCFLPIIPIMNTQGRSAGAAFMKNVTYGFDQHLVTLSSQINEEGKYQFYTENNKLLAKKDGAPYVDTWVDPLDSTKSLDAEPIATYDIHSEEIYKDVSIKCTRRALEIYYTDRPYNQKGSTNTVYALLKQLTTQQYVLYADNDTEPTKYTGQEEFKDYAKYTPSFVLLHKDGMFAYIYKTGTTTVGSYTTTGYDWKNYQTEDLFKDVLNTEYANKNPLDIHFVEEVTKNWRHVFNKGFDNQKTRNFWTMSGIFYGIHVGLVLFMGFMLWLLTRGKQNPNRGLKVYTCFWIAAWTCIAPALLAMIAGFVLTIAQQVAFIALMGLRTMWLAMRQLNPRY